MPVATILTILANSHQTIDTINNTCTAKGLPPALKFGADITDIEGNQDYRFEGFGLIAGLPPKLAFWVHYKPDSSDHVALGRFTMPISIGKLSEIQSLVGQV
ncbi:hypothetical protein [Leptolyngbya sp. NIES-2104]|uniref:hypothetical protein n=1 Tax=Leptolyngbya sp. NIES-2104 TaxID=1552121 RepID=UPI0006EC9B1F|nr:hypothetical protein [Leptolyngbya sp. NIES-2104]GAP94818.1 hypothetical protein NIES2104_13350 [Leptolyngbya sp. NIES-2104]